MKRNVLIIFLLLILLVVVNLLLIVFMLQNSNESLSKSSMAVLSVEDEVIDDEEVVEEIVEDESDLFVVSYVVDGDTLEIENGERVRLICVDTPEKGKAGYLDAKQYLEELVLNKKIKLEQDISDRDKYERLLRYVYLEDGSLVNEMIVKKGYATIYRYEPDVSLCSVIQSAEDYAKNHDLGIWEDEDTDDDSKEKLDYVCETNYYNCGDFSTYEESKIVFDYCGGANNDVHYLDADKDGLPCESLL